MKMKTYKATEVAKMLKVSEGSIYEMVRQGKLQKVEGLGRSVRIPADELKRLKGEEAIKRLPHDPKKVDLIETYLGVVRKLKDHGWFILRDLAALIKTDAGNIKKCIQPDYTKLITLDESMSYGITTNKEGSRLISYSGIEEYSMKSKAAVNWNRLLRELAVSVDSCVKDNFGQNDTETTITPTETDLRIFDKTEFGKLRVRLNNYQPIFNLNDVGFALGYTKQNAKGTLYLRKDLIENLCQALEITGVSVGDTDVNATYTVRPKYAKAPYQEKLSPADNQVITKDMDFNKVWIPENALYDLALESKAKNARSFRKWVTSEVLPAIRQTGGYVAQGREEDFIKNYLDNFSPEVKELMVQDLKKNRQQLEEKLETANKLLAEIER